MPHQRDAGALRRPADPVGGVHRWKTLPQPSPGDSRGLWRLFTGQVASSALLRADYRPPRWAVASHTQGVTAQLTGPPFSTLHRPPPWSSLFVEFRFLPLSLAFSLLSVVFGELFDR